MTFDLDIWRTGSLWDYLGTFEDQVATSNEVAVYMRCRCHVKWGGSGGTSVFVGFFGDVSLVCFEHRTSDRQEQAAGLPFHQISGDADDEVLAWLSVQSKVQMTCIWSSDASAIFFCFIKIHNGMTFLVPAYPGCSGKEAIKWMSVSGDDRKLATWGKANICSSELVTS